MTIPSDWFSVSGCFFTWLCPVSSKRQVTIEIQIRTPGSKAGNVCSIVIYPGPNVRLPQVNGLAILCTSISPVKWDLFQKIPNQSINGKYAIQWCSILNNCHEYPWKRISCLEFFRTIYLFIQPTNIELYIERVAGLSTEHLWNHQSHAPSSHYWIFFLFKSPLF